MVFMDKIDLFQIYFLEGLVFQELQFNKSLEVDFKIDKQNYKKEIKRVHKK